MGKWIDRVAAALDATRTGIVWVVCIGLVVFSGLKSHEAIASPADSDAQLIYNLIRDKKYQNTFSKLLHKDIKIVVNFPEDRKQELLGVLDDVGFVLDANSRDCGFETTDSNSQTKNRIVVSYFNDWKKLEKDGFVKLYQKRKSSARLRAFFDWVKKNPLKEMVFLDKNFYQQSKKLHAFAFVYSPKRSSKIDQRLLRSAIYLSVFDVDTSHLSSFLQLPEIFRIQTNIKQDSIEGSSQERTCKELAAINLMCTSGRFKNLTFEQFLNRLKNVEDYCINKIK